LKVSLKGISVSKFVCVPKPLFGATLLQFCATYLKMFYVMPCFYAAVAAVIEVETQKKSGFALSSS